MTARRRLEAVLVGLLMLGVLLRGGVTPSGAAALQLAAAALALAAAAVRGLPAASPGVLAIAAAWSALAIGSVAWSAAPDASLDASGGVLAAAVVFVLSACLLDRPARGRFVLRLAVLGAVVGSFAIATALPGERAGAPFGNPNHLAGWLLIPGGIALVAALRSGIPSRGRRESALLWFGLLVLVTAGIAASRSRGAALAAVVGLASLALLARLGPRRAVPLLVSSWLALALALALGAAWRPDGVPAQADGGESSAGMRWTLYGAVARASTQQGVLGVGIGAFAPAFQAHRPAEIPYRVEFAHSEPLHGAFELGMPFLLLVLLTASAGVARIRTGLPGRGSSGSWGPVVALAAVGGHALLDFPLHVPAIALASAALAGAVWRATGARHASARSLPTRAVLAGLGAALLILSGTRSVALGAEVRAERTLAAGDFAAAQGAARGGLRVRPARARLWVLLADAAEQAERIGAGGTDGRRGSLVARRRAVRASPRDARLWAALGRSHERVGNLPAALAAFDEARRRDPGSAAVGLGRARLLLRTGRPRDAARAVRAVVERHEIVSAPLFDALLRATADPALLQHAVPPDERLLRQAAGLLHRRGHARAAADSLSRALHLAPDDVVLRLEASRAWLRAGARQRAVALLRRGLARHPDEPRLRDALAQLDAVRRSAREAPPGAS